ncbi:MAG: adenylyltransferase/cytidyltransferase family protein [Bacteroidales bacterium]
MFERIRAKVLSAEMLPGIRQKFRDKKIVFCTGCFDILQSGHAVFFSQCREFGDLLVVGIGRDRVVEQLKGPGRPVNPEQNRLYLVAALEEVSYAVLNDTRIEEGKIDFRHILELLRPDVFVLNDDDTAIEPKKKLCERLGIDLRFVKREVPHELEPTSTTRIIDKINFAWKAPLRIDFSGGWTDVPFIMQGKKGYVSNVAISPLIERKGGKLNFSGYPRGSGLSTSTAVKLLEMISAKTYNAESKSLQVIAEDLFNLENRELNWAIGRQDQYSIVYGGFHCFEFGTDYARPVISDIPISILEDFQKRLLLIHTGVSRNAQTAVEEVYRNYKTPEGSSAIDELARCGYEFAVALQKGDFALCAEIMNRNFAAQKKLARSTSNDFIEEVYQFALTNGALGGKICGAGGGGAFVFITPDPEALKHQIKNRFVECFEIDFRFEYRNVKELNKV